MSERPTPETDAFDSKWDSYSNPFQAIDLARKLERERDEARRQCLQWLEEWHLTDRVRCNMKSERDEAREKYDNLATEHMLVVNKICGERRDALALANQMSESNQVLMADVKHYRDKIERYSPSNNDVYLKPVLEAVTKMAAELKAERDEARKALIEIEQVFIDSDDTYEDWRKMGNIARAALEEINE